MLLYLGAPNDFSSYGDDLPPQPQFTTKQAVYAALWTWIIIFGLLQLTACAPRPVVPTMSDTSEGTTLVPTGARLVAAYAATNSSLSLFLYQASNIATTCILRDNGYIKQAVHIRERPGKVIPSMVRLAPLPHTSSTSPPPASPRRTTAHSQQGYLFQPEKGWAILSAERAENLCEKWLHLFNKGARIEKNTTLANR